MAFRALREDLVVVRVGLVHDAEHALDLLEGHVLVEQVTHGVQ
jgi:hypothetical protein